jgi:hypothetical protein
MNTKKKEILYIPDAPHAIHIWLSEHEQDKENIFAAIHRMLF